MCFHIKVTADAQFERNTRENDQSTVKNILENVVPNTNLPLFHVSGFQHPKLFIYTNKTPNFPTIATWGLIPTWIQNETQKATIWDKTLNARSETIFEKPSFKDAALENRCVIYLNGFYEFYHSNGKTYPHFITQKNKKALCVAGLFTNWQNPETNKKITSFTIVTTKGDDFMAKIHNNPKLKEPRMPIILNTEDEDFWLHEINSYKDIQKINTASNTILDAHTVQVLSGKNYMGNIEAVSNFYEYPELTISKLFD